MAERYTFTLKDTSPVTHDTYRLVFDRPEGFDWTPGQCTHWALDKEGWRDEDRPFTMTSQPEEPDRVEFVIKCYPDHEGGVTRQIPQMSPGDRVIGDAPAGAITDRGGPGVFIAGGAGITPFIPILRRRAKDGKMQDCTLIYSNRTEADIILREEWERTEGLETVFTVTDQPDAGVHTRMIDADLLAEHMGDPGRDFYICGPKAMVNDVREALKAAGVAADNIVTEHGW